MDMPHPTAAERLGSLRAAMAAAGVDAYLIPRADAHQAEYVPAFAERLQWLTGFTGSAGAAVVLGNVGWEKTAGKDMPPMEVDMALKFPEGGFPAGWSDLAPGLKQEGDVLVIRYEGPKGGPGMREMLSTTAALYGQGV